MTKNMLSILFKSSSQKLQFSEVPTLILVNTHNLPLFIDFMKILNSDIKGHRIILNILQSKTYTFRERLLGDILDPW